ncbi:phage baseplate plug family protein [Proteus terrae]|uniref:phage baseplate plug family protein n=1 Tax=Proteus terrae TaxID=1574161 RepID=UPI00301C559E
MIYEIPVSSKPIQEQIFTLFDMNIRLTLYFNSVSKGWQFDLFDADKNKVITQRQGLAVNAPSLLEKNLPFILMLSDKSQFGINSVSRKELGNRLRLYVIDKEVWREAIRTTT